MPALYPDPTEYGWLQSTVFSSAFSVSSNGTTAFSIADPVYAVPWAFINNAGTLAITGTAGTDAVSATIQARVAYGYTTNNTAFWTITGGPIISFGLTNAATVTASASIFTNGTAGTNAINVPGAAFAYQIMSASANAPITVTMAWTGYAIGRRG